MDNENKTRKAKKEEQEFTSVCFLILPFTIYSVFVTGLKSGREISVFSNERTGPQINLWDS
jgi:hypothetical protein